MSVPFSEIPGQSRLFLDYQRDPLSISKFYPSAVDSISGLTELIPEVLANYRTDRNTLCDALEKINRRYAASEQTFENIDRLRQADSVAIVTGQQAGLFTGPLYTIYKALSVVKTTEYLRGQGVNAVPVFWVASEDHDLEEVSNAFFLDAEGKLAETRVRPQNLPEGVQVGFIPLDNSVESAVEEIISSLPATEFRSEVAALLNETWASGRLYGDAFSDLLSRLLTNYGIILFDPVDSTLKELAAPIYSKAIERSGEIVSALLDRDKELAAAGYHSQVLVTPEYFPLFLHGDGHTRHSLKNTGNGTFKTKSGAVEFSLNDLVCIAADDPNKLSPTVVLRPVVQDYLLPTLCYFGGGAEIAYFAQNSEVYRIMGRPVTPIFHRQSFTIVEGKFRRTMDKYGLAFTDLFEGREALIAGIIEKYVSPDLAKTFDDVEVGIKTELDRLEQGLSALDPTLAGNLETRRRKVLYHLSALRKKSHFAKTEKNEIVQRRIGVLLAALLPNMHLQERTLNVAGFLNAYGSDFLDWIYEAIDLDDKGHRIIYF